MEISVAKNMKEIEGIFDAPADGSDWNEVVCVQLIVGGFPHRRSRPRPAQGPLGGGEHFPSPNALVPMGPAPALLRIHAVKSGGDGAGRGALRPLHLRIMSKGR